VIIQFNRFALATTTSKFERGLVFAA
jgi:hypothetical protein